MRHVPFLPSGPVSNLSSILSLSTVISTTPLLRLPGAWALHPDAPKKNKRWRMRDQGRRRRIQPLSDSSLQTSGPIGLVRLVTENVEGGSDGLLLIHPRRPSTNPITTTSQGSSLMYS